jgi:carbon storage regulator CsrA
MINDDVEVVVTSIRDGSVRLGFAAPEEVKINRKEVWEARRRTGVARREEKLRLMRDLFPEVKNADSS